MNLLRLLFLGLVIYIVYLGAQATAARRQANRRIRRN